MGPEISFACSQYAASSPSPVSDEFSPYPHYLWSILIICSYVISRLSNWFLSFKVFDPKLCTNFSLLRILHVRFISFPLTWSRSYLVKNTPNETAALAVTHVQVYASKPSHFRVICGWDASYFPVNWGSFWWLTPVVLRATLRKRRRNSMRVFTASCQPAVSDTGV